MRYLEYLCGLSLSFAGNKRWAFGVYFLLTFLSYSIIFCLSIPKTKFLTIFLFVIFVNRLLSSIFRLSPIERCFYFCRSSKRSTGHSRTTILLTCWLLFYACLPSGKKITRHLLYQDYIQAILPAEFQAVCKKFLYSPMTQAFPL